MNSKKALKILKREGYKIERHKDHYLYYYGCYDLDPEVLTDRDIISMARAYTSDNIQNTKRKEPVKKYTHRKNRRETYKALFLSDFDRIPSNGFTKEEDVDKWG